MCRQNQVLGFSLLAFGLGVLIGCCMESGFWSFVLGLGAIVFGFIQIQKR